MNDLFAMRVNVDVPILGEVIHMERSPTMFNNTNAWHAYEKLDCPGEQDPSSRRVELTTNQYGKYCLRFTIHSPSRQLLSEEAWGENPQEAADRLDARLRTLLAQVTWSPPF